MYPFFVPLVNFTRRLVVIRLHFLCAVSAILCVSAVNNGLKTFTAETPKAPRTRREVKMYHYKLIEAILAAHGKEASEN